MSESSLDVDIRLESQSDYPAVHSLTERAFASTEFGHQGEAQLVAALRSRGDCLSLVADLGQQIVGHIMFSPVEVTDGESRWRGVGLAPMSVEPLHHRKGVGSQLVQAGLRAVCDSGLPFAVVLGHVEYYPRFGFETAAAWAVEHGFSGIPQDLFFIRVFDPESFPRTPDRRPARYGPDFGPQFEQ